MTAIGKEAFYNCDNLVSVTIQQESPVAITQYTFTNRANAILYVPRGCKGAYQTADYWKEFKEIEAVQMNWQKDVQTLTLEELPVLTYGDEPYQLPTQTNQGLPLRWGILSDHTVISFPDFNDWRLVIEGTGTAQLTAFQDGNDKYEPFSKEFWLTVEKAPLTITASDCTKYQGEDNPTLSVWYKGFVYDENVNVLTTKPTVTTEATKDSPVGEYSITVSGAEAENYYMEYVNGVMKVILQPSLVVSFADAAVKTLCVANWDTDGDGQLSKDEAVAVTDLGTVFTGNSTIKTFNELQYFEGLKGIGIEAFNGCNNLSSVIIPSNVESIEASAFRDCFKLNSINIPEGVSTIGEGAFVFCSSLKSIVIPSSVSMIESGAFSYCSDLVSISVDSNNASYDSHDNCNAIIEKEGNVLIQGCKSTVIPNTVTRLGDGAIQGVDLSSIDIPQGVEYIGNGNFSECGEVSSITIPSSVVWIGVNCFSGSTYSPIVIVRMNEPISIDSETFSERANATLYVPKGSKAAYKAADYWKEFKEIVELGNGEQQKCATPTIAYDKGELVFSCETEGVTFISEVKVADAKNNEGERVKLVPTYQISVYATKDGYDNSDMATVTIQWRDGRPLFTGFSNITMDGKAANDVNGDGKIDVADIATIISEMAAQARKQGNADM